jgi:hypothetical protein
MQLKIFPCKFCEVRFVFLTTNTGSVLPVECYENNDNEKKILLPIKHDDIFDGKIHRSHLINCEQRRQNWDKDKETFLARDKAVFNQVQRNMLR